MKALVLEKNGFLNYKDVADPQVKADECLVEVKSAGICSSDIYRGFDHGAYHYPLIMGHEFAGVIAQTGTGVRGFKKGDRVAVFPLIPCQKCVNCKKQEYAQCLQYDYYGSRRDGAFAQFLAVKAWNLFKIPKDLSLDKAALLEPVSVGIHAVKKIKIKKEDRVLVIGAGLIGLSMTKYLLGSLKAKNIYLVDRNDEKLMFARKDGVRTINSQKDHDWAKRVISETKGGCQHVFEVCGSALTYQSSLEVVCSHGNVIWVGNIDGDLTIPRKAVSSILRREIVIHGCWNSRFKHQQDDWKVALEFLRKDADADKWITHYVSLKDSNEMFQELCSRKLQKKKDHRPVCLKAMVHPNGQEKENA